MLHDSSNLSPSPTEAPLSKVLESIILGDIYGADVSEFV